MSPERLQRVLQHLPMVRHLASAHTTGARSATVAYIRAGVLALLEADESYCADDGVPFDVYATSRVLQAMRVIAGPGGPNPATPARFAVGPAWLDRPGTQLETPFDELPADERQVLHKYLVDDTSIKDIARDMGISSERVRALRKKAIRRLRARRELTDGSYQANEPALE